MDGSPGEFAGEREGAFGARLRRAREAAGLSQEELAERAGLSPNTVGGLERGEHRRPYPATIRALADALGLTDSERAALTATSQKSAHPATVMEDVPFGLAPPLTPLIGRDREVEGVSALLRPGACPAGDAHWAWRRGKDRPGPPCRRQPEFILRPRCRLRPACGRPRSCARHTCHRPRPRIGRGKRPLAIRPYRERASQPSLVADPRQPRASPRCVAARNRSFEPVPTPDHSDHQPGAAATRRGTLWCRCLRWRYRTRIGCQ